MSTIMQRIGATAYIQKLDDERRSKMEHCQCTAFCYGGTETPGCIVAPVSSEIPRVERVAMQLHCTYERAQIYLNYRDEGYSPYVSRLMAGLCDPSE